jgi:protein-disulfide isomerase
MEENTQTTNTQETDMINNPNPQSNQSQIAGAIIVAGLIIAGAILLNGNDGTRTQANTESGNKMEPATLDARPISAEDHIVGNPKAKTIILEYSDLDCPFCKNFHMTMKQVVANNDDVAWVYRHYPIPQLHPDAAKKAEATECAWEQGGNDAFWAFADKLFETKYSLSELSSVARGLGLNVDAFNSCLASGKYAAKVQGDVTDGQKMGVNGTPSSFILVKGKVADTIGGAQPLATVNQKLEALK